MLHPGLYEQVINNAMTGELAEIPEARKSVAPIDKAEASKVLAQYLADVVQKGLDNVLDNGGDISAQIGLTNQIVDLIQNTTKEAGFAALGVDRRAEQLLALLRETDPRLAVGKTAADIERPETSIAQSSLFTGAVHEPQMFTELKKEIVSADRIDMLVSFIKWSGLRLIMDELREFTQNGGELRIITTSYMGATDVKAIEELRKLPNTQIKVSYNTKTTRLHAKAYIFYRETGFTTAYVGSSNLSNAALTSGLEWNTKVTRRDLPETIDKIAATFEYYWNDREFEYYAEDQKERLVRALKAEKYFDTNNADVYTMDINPYSYQQEILDKLEAERTVRGYTRNLVVAATGTGKTVISALDYKRFRKQNPDRPCRLLFVAHREEILKQSLYTFRAVLKDANFGELFVGNYKPESIDNLFLSIQTFNSQSFTEKTSPDFYDYIIVDEFHHAAAPTYQKLLSYYQPRILLGLTATPERMDGKSILPYFHNRIAAEIRLPEAIDRKLLCPFQYFGVTDTVDLDALKWSAGGYQKSELEHIYTFSGAVADRRADHVVTALLSNTTRSVSREIKDGFVSVPKGCYIQLEKKAAKYILENIRASYGNTAGLVARAASFAEDSGLELTLKSFLDYYHLDPRAIYKFSSFSRICARADVIEDFLEPLEDILTKAFAKLAVIDSRRWISFLLDVLPRLDNLDFAALPDAEKQMMQMFYVTVWGKAVENWDDEEVLSDLYTLSDSTVLLGELLELLRYRFEQIDFIDEPVELGFDCPLDLHCTYTRDQLLVALDFMKPSTVREGVKWLPEKNIDVFFVTLNKADKDYSPTTMYNDYSINESLFHWQSQSTTAENSPTGQRYIHHKERGSKVLLFVREFKSDRVTGGAEAYTYLGTANYVKHTGSRPMNITWQLDRPIPAKFLKKTNKLVVG